MRIYLESKRNAKERIERRKISICIVGMGTIGLPAAIFFARKGFKVTGFDLDGKKVEEVNQARSICEYPELLRKVVENGRLTATTDSRKAMSNADVVIVCVPTPLNERKDINLGYVLSAAESIGSNMRRGTVIILESSVSPGSTRIFGRKLEEKSGLKAGADFGLAYTPERYNPTLPGYAKAARLKSAGGTLLPFNKIGRVVGGIDRKSAFIAKTLYSEIIDADVVEVSSIEAAEVTKLLENIFRDVNIALVNEISKIFSKLGLNTYEIVDAAKSKPYAFMPHYPGTGVGGDCIPVGAWYLIKRARDLGVQTELMKTARDVNDSMPAYVVELLELALKKAGKKLKGSRICLLGLAYKRNMNDSRHSPAFEIIKELKEGGADVGVCDPLMEGVRNIDVKLTPLKDAFEGKDAVVIVTDHDIFRKIDWRDAAKQMRSKVIVDGRNFLDRRSIGKLGFVYEGIGKPL